MFAASYQVLFRLYLPNRYVHSMIAFFCIVIAVCWRPDLDVHRSMGGVAAGADRRLALPAAIVWFAAAWCRSARS